MRGCIELLFEGDSPASFFGIKSKVGDGPHCRNLHHGPDRRVRPDRRGFYRVGRLKIFYGPLLGNMSDSAAERLGRPLEIRTR